MRFTVISIRSKSSKRSIICPYRSAGLVDDLGPPRPAQIRCQARKQLHLPPRQTTDPAPPSAPPWRLYLALPVSLHPLWVLLPSTVLLGVAVAITAGTFKKYL